MTTPTTGSHGLTLAPKRGLALHRALAGVLPQWNGPGSRGFSGPGFQIEHFCRVPPCEGGSLAELDRRSLNPKALW